MWCLGFLGISSSLNLFRYQSGTLSSGQVLYSGAEPSMLAVRTFPTVKEQEDESPRESKRTFQKRQNFFSGKEGPWTDGPIVSTDAIRGSLSLTNLSSPMSGVYICKAHNEVGSAQCNVTLEVSTGQWGVSVVKEKIGCWWGWGCKKRGLSAEASHC